MNPGALWHGHEIQQLVKALTDKQGIDIKILLSGTDLSAEQFKDPSLRISIEQEELIYSQVATSNNDPYLAIEQGSRLGVNHFGVLGQAMLGANTLREALLIMSKYSSVISWSLIIQLDFEKFQGEDIIAITLQTGGAVDKNRAFELESTIASIHTLLNQIVLSPINFTLVELSTKQYADDLTPYEVLFNCPIIFDANVTRIILNRSLLRKRLPYATPELQALRIQLCQKTMGLFKQKSGLINALQTYFTTFEYGVPSITQAAEHFHRSERTLRRQLNDLETSFQTLIDNYRFEKAKDDLTNSLYTIETIAKIQGFSDSRSFRTAFKRWSGKTPSQFREDF
jgi:AraC-like DNA-binding protein